MEDFDAAAHVGVLPESHDDEVRPLGQRDRLRVSLPGLLRGPGLGGRPREEGCEPALQVHGAGVLHTRPGAELVADALVDGHSLLGIALPRPIGDHVVRVVRQRPDHRDAAARSLGERQQPTLVAQQHGRPLRRHAGQLPVLGRAQHALHGRLVHVGVLKQPQTELGFENRPHRLVQLRRGNPAFRNQLGQVLAEDSAGHVHVGASLERPQGGVRPVSGVALGHQVPHPQRVAYHESAESPCIAQQVPQQKAARRGWHVVEVHVGAHDASHPGFDGRAEGRQMDVEQLGVGQVHGVVVAPPLRSPVAGKVLGAGQQVSRAADVGPLYAAHLGARHCRSQERVLAGTFYHPSPARVARDVQHGGEGPVDPGGARLAGCHRLGALSQRRVPGGRQGQRHGEDVPVPVDHVQPEYQRDAQPRLSHRDALEPVELRRPPHPQHGPSKPLAQTLLGLRGLRHISARKLH